MPNDLINTDPLIAQNFFLEIDGSIVTILAGVSGLDVEMEVATTQQVGKDGKSQTIKTLAGRNKAPDLSLTRMAPADSTQDKMWGWFNDIMKRASRSWTGRTSERTGRLCCTTPPTPRSPGSTSPTAGPARSRPTSCRSTPTTR